MAQGDPWRRFEDRVDPDRSFPSSERERRAKTSYRAFMRRIARKEARTRAKNGHDGKLPSDADLPRCALPRLWPFDGNERPSSRRRGQGRPPRVSVAPDGSLWFGLWQSRTGHDCEGLARFDGDGEFLPESRCWDEGAVWWEDENGFWGGDMAAIQDRWIELELGGAYRLDGVIVQADDDGYLLSYRDPDSGAWLPLWTVPPAYGFGLTTRPAPFGRDLMHVLHGTVTDAVRFEADFGDGMYSVSEIQLFGEPVAD